MIGWTSITTPAAGIPLDRMSSDEWPTCDGETASAACAAVMGDGAGGSRDYVSTFNTGQSL
jgi:hypothetical protein